MVRGQKSDHPVRAPVTKTPARAEPRFGPVLAVPPPPVFQDPVPRPKPAAPAERGAPSRIAPRASLLRKSKRAKSDAQPALDLDASSNFQLPPLSLLQALGRTTRRAESLNDASLEQNARLLERVLGEFGVQGGIARVNPGPVVTRYELDPAPGTKTSRVIGLADE